MKTTLIFFFTIFIIKICAFKDEDIRKSYMGDFLQNNNYMPSSIAADTYPQNQPEEIDMKSFMADFPKKEKSDQFFQHGLKLLNKKYDKLNKPTLKKQNSNRDYTVFPSLRVKRPVDVPSSPYFPPSEMHEEPKVRVKKVLPEFSRKKRSPDNTKAPEEPKSDSTLSTAKVAKTDNPTTAKAVTVLDNTDKKVERTESPPLKDDDKTEAKTGKPQRRGHKSRGGQKSKRKGKSGKRNHGRSGKHKSSKKSGKRSRNSKKDGRRLIAAKDALIENYPYVVSIQKEGEHWCSGAILNQRLIITTANCVWKSNRLTRMKIRACSRHSDHGGQVVKVAEVMKHPYWDIRKNPDNDIALLLTETFIKFSHTCHAVDLPNQVMMPIFDDAWVTGWGADRRDGIYPRNQAMTLQVYHARLMNREKCNNITQRYGVLVTDNFVCMEQIGKRAPCTRDTGAPAVSDGVVWGLASWGIRKMCGTERFPAMFSFTASKTNLDFIRNAQALLMSEQRLNPYPDRLPETPMEHHKTLMEEQKEQLSLQYPPIKLVVPETPEEPFLPKELE